MGRNLLKYSNRYPQRFRHLRRSLVLGQTTTKFPGVATGVTPGANGKGSIVINEPSPGVNSTVTVTIKTILATVPTTLATGAIPIPARSSPSVIAAALSAAITVLAGVDSTVGVVNGSPAVLITMTAPADSMVSASAACATVGNPF
jgi:hypothetical protein